MDTGGKKVPLDANNLLLRGSTLSKTPWAVGVAVNVGRDAKIVQNMTKAPRKVCAWCSCLCGLDRGWVWRSVMQLPLGVLLAQARRARRW